jgi:hypothetical protein
MLEWHRQTYGAIHQLANETNDLSTMLQAELSSVKESMVTREQFSDVVMTVARRVNPGAFTSPASPVRTSQNCHQTEMNNTAPLDSITGNDVSTEDCDKIHKMYRMRSKYDSLGHVWREWNGIDEFADEYGGIKGRNKCYGSKWRKHLNKQQYSRHNRIIKGIENYAKLKKVSDVEAVTQLNDVYVAVCGTSASTMVKYLQSHGFLQKGKSRGKQARFLANRN